MVPEPILALSTNPLDASEIAKEAKRGLGLEWRASATNDDGG